MTHMVDEKVIKFPKTQRRASFAKLTANYLPALVTVQQNSMLDDGEHFDPETGEPQCRPLDRSEMRHGAVASLSEFFTGLLFIRAHMEDDSTPLPGSLLAFHNEARCRAYTYRTENLGICRLLADKRSNRRFLAMEHEFVRAIFDALMIEARNDPEFDEPQFWADIFRGFADADPSGVVLRAAGLVLLDHMDDFSRALDFHK